MSKTMIAWQECALKHACPYVTDKVATIAALREEVADKEYKVKTLDHVYQKAIKDIVRVSQENAALRARVEELERELAAERAKKERGK